MTHSTMLPRPGVDATNAIISSAVELSIPFHGQFLASLAKPVETNRGNINLRLFQPGDASELFSATKETSDLLCAWMTWCQPGYSLLDAQAFIKLAAEEWQRDQGYSFASLDPKTQEVLGSVSLNQINRRHQTANLGYWVRSSRSRRGIASRAVRLVAEFGLRKLGLKRLEIMIPEGNVASQRVAQKVRAKFEGILRHRIVLQGKTHDAILYSLIENDLLSPTELALPGFEAPGASDELKF